MPENDALNRRLGARQLTAPENLGDDGGVKPEKLDHLDLAFHEAEFRCRHLTTSQKAMAAARARTIYERQAKERQKRKPSDSVPANLPEQKRMPATPLARRYLSAALLRS